MSKNYHDGYFIYLATNVVNSKVYVGKTETNIKKRWSGHKTSARTRREGDYGRFHRAMNKYGFDNFKIELIAKYETEAEMMAAETYYIDLYDSTNPDKGYNMTRGGEIGAKGYRHTEEARQRMSEIKKVIFLGEGNPFFGKTHSEETKALQSEIRARFIQENREVFDQMNIEQCDLTREECLLIQKDYLDNHTSFTKLVERYDTNLHAIHNIIHGTYAAIRGTPSSPKRTSNESKTIKPKKTEPNVANSQMSKRQNLSSNTSIKKSTPESWHKSMVCPKRPCAMFSQETTWSVGARGTTQSRHAAINTVSPMKWFWRCALNGRPMNTRAKN
jgi:group I intron endonuclease